MAEGLLTKDEIFQRVSDHKAHIRALGVKQLGLFGSFVRGQQTAISDIDFLVEFEKGQKDYDRFLALSGLLEEILGMPIELVTLESLSPYLGPSILHEVEYVSLAA